jgi:NAD(P)H-dependent FMN reductase
MSDAPVRVLDVRRLVAAADAFVVSTPVYQASYSDILSRLDRLAHELLTLTEAIRPARHRLLARYA